MNTTSERYTVDLSDMQWKMIRVLSRSQGTSQVAGFGAAPKLSACRALVRKGLAIAGSRTGHYALTKAGQGLVDEAMERRNPDA